MKEDILKNMNMSEYYIFCRTITSFLFADRLKELFYEIYLGNINNLLFSIILQDNPLCILDECLSFYQRLIEVVPEGRSDHISEKYWELYLEHSKVKNNKKDYLSFFEKEFKL